MKESTVNKKILKVMFGFLFIGGVAAILGSFARRRIPGVSSVMLREELDDDILVYGAHA